MADDLNEKFAGEPRFVKTRNAWEPAKKRNWHGLRSKCCREDQTAIHKAREWTPEMKKGKAKKRKMDETESDSDDGNSSSENLPAKKARTQKAKSKGATRKSECVAFAGGDMSKAMGGKKAAKTTGEEQMTEKIGDGSGEKQQKSSRCGKAKNAEAVEAEQLEDVELDADAELDKDAEQDEDVVT